MTMSRKRPISEDSYGTSGAVELQDAKDVRYTPANRPVRKMARSNHYSRADGDQCTGLSDSSGGGASKLSADIHPPLKRAKAHHGSPIRPSPSTALHIDSPICPSLSASTVAAIAALPKATKPVSREARRKQNHSMIERRRREKMNKAFADLRGMVPGLMDEGGEQKGEFKLEVLEKTVEHMRELKELLAGLDSPPGGRNGMSQIRNTCARCQTLTRSLPPDIGEKPRSGDDTDDDGDTDAAGDEDPSGGHQGSSDKGLGRAMPVPTTAEPGRATVVHDHPVCFAKPSLDQYRSTPSMAAVRNETPSTKSTSRPLASPEKLGTHSPMSRSMSRSDSQATVPEEHLPVQGSHRYRSEPDAARSLTSRGPGIGPANTWGQAEVLPMGAPLSSKVIYPPVAQACADIPSAPFRNSQHHGIYLPPPLTTNPSPVSPFFTMDSSHRVSIEPSPMLPPLPGMQSLFGDIPMMAKLDWRGESAERETTRRSSTEGYVDASLHSATAMDRTRVWLGKEEEEAATALLAFSSPEIMTPFHHASTTVVGLDRWSLDHAARPVETANRMRSYTGMQGSRDDEERSESLAGMRTAKSARDILGGKW